MKWKEFAFVKPPFLEQVIVQREYKNEVTAAYYQSCKECGYKNRFSITEGNNLTFEDVVYWQRLPQPKLNGRQDEHN